jgi:hypothetical protein
MWLTQGLAEEIRNRVEKYSAKVRQQNPNFDIEPFWLILGQFKDEAFNQFRKAVYQLRELQEARGEKNIALKGII